jgi:hypothetical protein
MSKTSRVAAAVAAGYVLGRFKKLRLAVMVSSALANDNVRQGLVNAVKQRSGRFSSTSAGGTLTQQVGSKLVDAGKAAAMTVAASRVDALSDRLAARSGSLRGGDREDAGEEDRGPEGEKPRDEVHEPTSDETEEAEGPEEPEEEEPVTRASRRGRSASPGRRSGS